MVCIGDSNKYKQYVYKVISNGVMNIAINIVPRISFMYLEFVFFIPLIIINKSIINHINPKVVAIWNISFEDDADVIFVNIVLFKNNGLSILKKLAKFSIPIPKNTFLGYLNASNNINQPARCGIVGIVMFLFIIKAMFAAMADSCMLATMKRVVFFSCDLEFIAI